MMRVAVDALLARLEALGVPKPPDGALEFTVEDDWNTTARAILNYIFGLARGGRLPIGVEQAVVDTLLPLLTLPCPGQHQEGHDGEPACTESVSLPKSCPACYRPILR